MRLPYHPVQFTKAGTPADTSAAEDLAAFVRAQRKAGVTDLLVLAHGWNNDLSQARHRYETLCDTVDRLRAERGRPAGRTAVVGLLWPAVQWADDDQVAGGGLSVGGDPADSLLERIDAVVEDPQVRERLAALAPRLDTSAKARADFLDLLRTVMPPAAEVADDDPAPVALLDGDTEAVFASTADAVLDLSGESLSGAGVAPADGQADLGDLDLDGAGVRDDVGAAAGFDLGRFNPADIGRQLLNTTTYYTMKKRSGLVAVEGLVPLLGVLPSGVRVHLVGHSFGARLVSLAAATVLEPVDSVSLLQGAFSHRAFALDNGRDGHPGAFRKALKGGVDGPLVATHTHNDKAVGIAYAVASRLAQQAGSGLGGPDDVYGGLGANGAVATAEADQATLLSPDGEYTFRDGRILNLHADLIKNHGDVSGPPVANVVLQVLTRAQG